MVVVGSELPLCEGITDYLNEHNPKIIVIGPTAMGARLEGSKSFAKEFMQRHMIPTAAYFQCTSSNIKEGIEFLKTLSAPYVLKADGLAGGKGVLILEEESEAIKELEHMIGGKFGQASSCVVIEEFLSGIEFSVFVLTDGQSYYLLPEAKDYKRVGEGDKGLNTGGMGAISPVPFLSDELLQKVKNQIIEPTVNGLNKDKIDYKGFIFFGLINVKGSPYVIEYNCRMGDPETEVVMPRLESDIVEAFEALKTQSLHLLKPDYSPLAAATVILVSDGYPGNFETGKAITGMEDVSDCFVFHAGTKIESDQLVTAGGRVLAITSMGEDFKEAVNNSLANAERISYEGKYYRRDIGFDL
jgi:phosphoribosylamine--glycine ligase